MSTSLVERIHKLLVQGEFDAAALELERLESDFEMNDENSVLARALITRMRGRIIEATTEEIAQQRHLLTEKIKSIVNEVAQNARTKDDNQKRPTRVFPVADSDSTKGSTPRVIVICEGSSIGNRRKDFDAQIYNRIFGPYFPEVKFVSGGSSDEIAKARTSVQQAFAVALPSTKIVALCDRDDKSPEEVIDFEQNGGIVLTERNLESYILADDVILALLAKVGKQDLKNEALEIKRAALTNSVNRKNAPDDLKSAAGDIYVELKRLLGLTQSGNSTEAFIRDTLSPLVLPPMPTYNALKAATIDRVV